MDQLKFSILYTKSQRFSSFGIDWENGKSYRLETGQEGGRGISFLRKILTSFLAKGDKTFRQ